GRGQVGAGSHGIRCERPPSIPSVPQRSTGTGSWSPEPLETVTSSRTWRTHLWDESGHLQQPESRRPPACRGWFRRVLTPQLRGIGSSTAIKSSGAESPRQQAPGVGRETAGDIQYVSTAKRLQARWDEDAIDAEIAERQAASDRE